MTTAAVPGDRVAAADDPTREQRLRARVAALRTRRPGATRSRWLLTAGGVLMPLGAVTVLLGWTGASRTPLVFEQIPYMISGGLLGLALVFAGGFLYFSYWQTLLVREQRQARDDLVAALRRIEEVLVTPAPPGTSTVGVPAQRPEPRLLVATPAGSVVHRPDCTAVAGRTDLRTVEPGAGALAPCRLCEPFAD